MKGTIGIVSLGCPRNLVDSEHIVGRLVRRGYRVADIARAETAIVNTCAFVQDAKAESIDAILDLIELKKAGKLKKIIVCGCLVQRYAKELAKEFPEVDSFVGPQSLVGEGERYPLTPKSFAYLKICEGCVNSCSFCAVPLIKGRLESLEDAQVISKLRELDAAGITEIDVIGQDITGYGLDRGEEDALPRIIRELLANSSRGPRWFRLLYLHPSRVTDGLLAVMKSDPRVCRYIDLPLQHINDRILKAMNRHTSKKQITGLIEKVRRSVPGVAVRTTFIVGFPGETEKEFGELLRFIEEMRFERLGAFMYSREEGTAAYSFPDQVPDDVMRERFDRIMQAQQEISREETQKLRGASLEVLIDEKDGDRWLGRTRHDAPEVDGIVFVSSKKPLEPGQVVRATVTDTMEYDLCAEAENEPSE